MPLARRAWRRNEPGPRLVPRERSVMDSTDLIVLTPPCLPDPAPAIAACRAGGRVGADTSFVLIQKWRQHADRTGTKLPFWVHGGIGPNTAAACLAAGARGVVLDSQVLLARESPLSDAARKRIAGLDGSETVVLGARLGEAYRAYSRADSPAVQELVREEERLLAAELPAAEKLAAW